MSDARVPASGFGGRGGLSRRLFGVQLLDMDAVAATTFLKKQFQRGSLVHQTGCPYDGAGIDVAYLYLQMELFQSGISLQLQALINARDMGNGGGRKLLNFEHTLTIQPCVHSLGSISG